MTIEFNTDNVLSLSALHTTQIKKIDPVPEVNSLPDDGKELPLTEKKIEVLEKDIDDAVQKINEYVQQERRELQFSIDKDSGLTVIKVVDLKTQEVIRQIPGDEVLKVVRQINEGENLEIFNSYI